MTKISASLQKKMKTYRLSWDELQRALKMMGRAPKMQGDEVTDVPLHAVEWAVFSALWSEHCSYKSSKVHLKKFGKTLDQSVVNAVGENAGVVDLGQGERLVFKMESHNHPSFIEPYQGAATGVGGILRDIFTMGARPICSADYLCFGDDFSDRMPVLVDGVVRGIGGYGNSVGVPTITGQTNFHRRYQKNILVNAMSVGLLRRGENVALSAAKGPGNLVVYVGAKTGKDGVHGAAMASESFDENSDAKKPNVQIGDPYFEKLLIESCLEVLQQNLVVAIQDMGAAGLTSSSFEMASKGQVGMKLHLDQVPVRDSSLLPDEILLSESQERMLLVCEPAKLGSIQNLFHKWGLDASVVGEITKDRKVEIFWKNELLSSMDPDWLVEDCPQYERPFHAWKPINELSTPDELLSASQKSLLDQKHGLQSYLESESHRPTHAAKTALYSQYDQRVGLLTVRGANYDVGVQRLPDSGRGLSMVVGCRPWLMEVDAQIGARDACLYPSLQMSLKGFKPIGLTDCLNFGNPEKIEIMSEFVASVDAIVECSLAMKAPVVSGNVSFYNETLGENIISTPAIGVLGIRDSIEKLPEDRFLKAGTRVYRISSSQAFTAFAGQIGFWGDLSVQDSVKWMNALRELSFNPAVLANQMVSQGGVALSLLKMCRRGMGFRLDAALSTSDLVQDVLYQSLWDVETAGAGEFEKQAASLGLKTECLGVTQEKDFEISTRVKISVEEWRAEDHLALRRTIESLA